MILGAVEKMMTRWGDTAGEPPEYYEPANDLDAGWQPPEFDIWSQDDVHMLSDDDEDADADYGY